MMASQEEGSTLRRFFQYVEDRCLQAYDDLVIQNASDISRESDRVRNNANWTYLQEKKQKKKRQGEAIKRTDDEAAGATDVAYCGKHFRMGFMTVPPPQDRLPAPGQAFGVRSQSLTSVGADAADERKQPPPKPKRDPNTKLSGSAEALHTQTQEQDEVHFHACSEDSKKAPPPKPKRNPNTQLSSSFDESHVGNHGSHQTDTPSSQSRFWASRDDSESVYIEMTGNVPVKSPDDQNESVYEEMKYSDSCLSLCHIPQPFPNLLTHRPPLLVFPPFPPQRSPNSDESPLTPVDVTQLSMLGKKAGLAEHSRSSARSKDEEEWPPASNVTSSGRSSAPLPSGPYTSSSSAHNGNAHPRSQSACPSPVSAGHSRTPLSLKRPPPYNALMAGRPPEGAGTKYGNSAASLDDLTAPQTSANKDWRSRHSTEELKCLRQLGRSSSTSGVPSMPSAPQDHPALSQMPWLCGDATMMETIEKKRVLCRQIKSRQRAEKNLGKQDNLPAVPDWRRKQPPPYSAPSTAAAVLWDTAI